MEQIPLRRLRDIAEEIAPTFFTARQTAREERIVKLGAILLARFGIAALTFSRLAQALRYTTATLRWHFADLEDLLVRILHLHIAQVANALAAIPEDAPDAASRRRAAYIAATRGEDGDLSPAHQILCRDLATLPEEDRTAIETAWATVCNVFTEQERNLLDTPTLDTAEIDRLPAAAQPTQANAVRQVIPRTQYKQMLHAARDRPAQLLDISRHYQAADA